MRRWVEFKRGDPELEDASARIFPQVCQAVLQADGVSLVGAVADLTYANLFVHHQVLLISSDSKGRESCSLCLRVTTYKAPGGRFELPFPCENALYGK